MLLGKKIVVVMPAYNAAQTLEQTYNDLPHDFIDEVILVDDQSQDDTAGLAAKLGIHTVIHPQNRGYGGNQKTCYLTALQQGADIVIMVHPDYQYSPRLALSLAGMIASGHYEIALASRILGGQALKGGMPVYKYIANRLLTLIQNLFLGIKLSEYHTGYRAFSREVLEALPLEENSDNFVFDNQMLAQAAHFGFPIGEISCPTRYFTEASSIRLAPSIRYGIGVLATTLQLLLHKTGIKQCHLFSSLGQRLKKGG